MNSIKCTCKSTVISPSCPSKHILASCGCIWIELKVGYGVGWRGIKCTEGKTHENRFYQPLGPITTSRSMHLVACSGATRGGTNSHQFAVFEKSQVFKSLFDMENSTDSRSSCGLPYSHELTLAQKMMLEEENQEKADEAFAKSLDPAVFPHLESTKVFSKTTFDFSMNFD